jgi:hypothetical protein
MTWLHWQKTNMRVMAGALLLFFLATVSPGSGLVSLALATAAQDLEQAQDLYDFAEFQQAMDLVTSLIQGGQLTETEERDAYIIRARCAVELGLVNQAQEDFCMVHKLDQTWQPDPVLLPQDEVDVFNASLAGCQLAAAGTGQDEGGEAKPWYMKPVAWAAGAGAVILGVVLLGGGGDDDSTGEPTLAGFPDPPTK